MRKITLFSSLACAFLFSATTMAQGLSDVDAQKFMKVSTQSTEIKEGSWYVIEQSRDGVSYLYANASDNNKVYRKPNEETAVTLNGKVAETSKTALVRFAKVGETSTYNIIFGTGAYFSAAVHQTNVTFTTDADAAGAYYINPVTKSDGSKTFQFGTAKTGGTQLDNNSGGNALSGWNQDFKTVVEDKVGNNEWRLYEVELIGTEGQVTFTYSYQVDGDGKLTESVTTIPTANFPAPQTLPAYVNYTLPERTVLASDNGATIDVACTYDLPFEPSASYADAKWYIVDMHSNDSGMADVLSGEKTYIWTYDDTNTYNVSLPKRTIRQATELFGDASLWCFVGNPFDGFEIYNKAAGADMKLYRKGDGSGVTTADNIAVMSSVNSTRFTLAQSSQITGAACFKPVGHTYYLNTQANANVDSGLKYLTGWTATDGGSSCRFFTPTHFVKLFVDAMAGMPVGGRYVSAPTALTESDVTTLSSVKTALAADEWNTSVVTSDVEAILARLKPSIITLQPGGYYFLKSKSYQNKSNALMNYRKDTDGAYKCYVDAVADGQNPAINYIWQFVASGNGYKFNACNLDKYLSLAAADAASPVNSDLNGGNKFVLEDKGGAEYLIKNGADNMVMRTEGDGQVNYWRFYKLTIC